MYRADIAEGCLTAMACIKGIDIPHLNLTAMMPEIDNNSYQIHLDLTDNSNYEPKYMDMNDKYPEVLVAHHLSWVAIGLIIILICVSIYVGVLLYRRRLILLCRRLAGQARGKTGDKESNL